MWDGDKSAGGRPAESHLSSSTLAGFAAVSFARNDGSRNRSRFERGEKHGPLRSRFVMRARLWDKRWRPLWPAYASRIAWPQIIGTNRLETHGIREWNDDTTYVCVCVYIYRSFILKAAQAHFLLLRV